jgi:uncharacterized membrane protein YfcA
LSDARVRVQALLTGALAGLAGGLFGVGGGIVIIPVLTGRFGFTQHQAHGTSLAVIGATALTSIVVYGWHGNVAWGTAIVVAITSVITARYGARLANRLSSRGLARAFAVFIAIVAVRLLWKVPEVAEAEFHRGLIGALFDLGLGSLVGLVSGLMGVGGGIVAVPAFTLVLGMSQQLAQGTSLAIITAAAPAGALEHSRHGNVVWRWVPWMAAGAAAGGPLASWGVQWLPHALLVRAFALFLLANALRTWMRTRAPRPVAAADLGSAPDSASRARRP